MKTLAFIFALFLATSAAAEPCVSTTFDRAVPGAQNTSSFVSDVPSAQFPAFWQTGMLNGYKYRIYATFEGSVRPTDRLQDWEISLSCDIAGQICTTVSVGAAPDDAVATAEKIGQCLLGKKDQASVPEPSYVAPPQETALEQSDSEPTPAPTACGADLVDEATDIAILQRLLTMAGHDPGPVDGLLGPKSFGALDAFVPDAGWGTSIPEAIALVDQHLCNRLNPE